MDFFREVFKFQFKNITKNTIRQSVTFSLIKQGRIFFWLNWTYQTAVGYEIFGDKMCEKRRSNKFLANKTMGLVFGLYVSINIIQNNSRLKPDYKIVYYISKFTFYFNLCILFHKLYRLDFFFSSSVYRWMFLIFWQRN